MPGLLLVSRKDATDPVGSVPRPKAREALVPLLLISAIASGCLTVLHLTLSLGSGVRDLSRENVSMLFALCGGAMLVAQLVPFTGRRVSADAVWLLRPMLAALAATLIIAVFARTLWVLVPVFLLAGWSTATLKLLTNYLTSKVSWYAGFGPCAPVRGGERQPGCGVDRHWMGKRIGAFDAVACRCRRVGGLSDDV